MMMHTSGSIEAVYWVHADDHPPKETLVELSTPEQVREFVALLASDLVSDAVLTHTDRPRWETKIPDDDHPGAYLTVPDHWIIAGIHGQHGAMCYNGDDGHGSESVNLFSSGSGPDHEVIYETHDFPANCEISIEALTKALIEFLETAKRPLCIQWQESADDA